MKQYDTFIIGHLCIDEILNSAGEGEFSIGGAVVYSSYAALAGGNHVGILIKSAPREKMIPYILPVHTEDIYWLRSDSETTSIRNQFLDDKHERRITTALAQGSTITVAELPEGISAKIYQLAGLMKGDYEDDIIKVLAQRGKVALDMQGYLRVPDSSTKEMVYHVWDRKQEYFPHITYRKPMPPRRRSSPAHRTGGRLPA